mmetsp:Transcript_24474/g.55889  ORF Transcript_24474/g.55889 Transcript_24474/m.55889 type:complete len:173 (-) Transcript_24474:488-1006(-)
MSVRHAFRVGGGFFFSFFRYRPFVIMFDLFLISSRLSIFSQVYSESFIENLREKEKDEGSEIKSGFALYLNRISGDEDNEINSECVICLDKYGMSKYCFFFSEQPCFIFLILVDSENGEDIISSPNCSHIFHKECLLEWLVYKDVCPCCRAQIVNPEELKTCMELVLEDGDA